MGFFGGLKRAVVELSTMIREFIDIPTQADSISEVKGSSRTDEQSSGISITDQYRHVESLLEDGTQVVFVGLANTVIRETFPPWSTWALYDDFFI